MYKIFPRSCLIRVRRSTVKSGMVAIETLLQMGVEAF